MRTIRRQETIRDLHQTWFQWQLEDCQISGLLGQKGTLSVESGPPKLGWEGRRTPRTKPNPLRDPHQKVSHPDRNVGRWCSSPKDKPAQGYIVPGPSVPPTAQGPEAVRTEVPHRPFCSFLLPRPDRKCTAWSLPFPTSGRKSRTRLT